LNESVTPTLQAMLVADHIYTDATTNKKIVAGIFHQIVRRAAAPPAGEDGEGEEAPQRIEVPVSGMASGSPFCYLSLTNVRGMQEFTLRYVDLNEDKPLFETHFALEGQDPLAVHECVLPLPTLPVDETRTCALELLCADEPLGSYRIQTTVETE
jgi:hypothetical protein